MSFPNVLGATQKKGRISTAVLLYIALACILTFFALKRTELPSTTFPDSSEDAVATSSQRGLSSASTKPYDFIHRVPPRDSGFKTFSAASLDIPTEASEMLHFFHEEGYLVVDNVLRSEEVREAKSKFALLMKGMDVDVEENPTIEGFNEDVADPTRGIAGHSGIGHSAMSWFIRSRERVQQSFALALEAKYAPPDQRVSTSSSKSKEEHKQKKDTNPHDKLITSFDGLNYFRNPEINPDWVTSQKSWLHFDASQMEHAAYVQGIVNLVDCTDENDAGPVIFPRSHKTIFPLLMKAKEGEGEENEPSYYCRMDTQKWNQVQSDAATSAAVGDTRAFRVPLRAGSLVMWKSSTMHCNMGPLPRSEGKLDKTQWIRRLVSYICMIKDPMNTELTKARVEHFHKGRTTAHQPDIMRGFRDPADRPLIRSGAVIVEERKLPKGAECLL